MSSTSIDAAAQQIPGKGIAWKSVEIREITPMFPVAE